MDEMEKDIALRTISAVRISAEKKKSNEFLPKRYVSCEMFKLAFLSSINLLHEGLPKGKSASFYK